MTDQTTFPPFKNLKYRGVFVVDRLDDGLGQKLSLISVAGVTVRGETIPVGTHHPVTPANTITSGRVTQTEKMGRAALRIEFEAPAHIDLRGQRPCFEGMRLEDDGSPAAPVRWDDPDRVVVRSALHAIALRPYWTAPVYADLEVLWGDTWRPVDEVSGDRRLPIVQIHGQPFAHMPARIEGNLTGLRVLRDAIDDVLKGERPTQTRFHAFDGSAYSMTVELDESGKSNHYGASGHAYDSDKVRDFRKMIGRSTPERPTQPDDASLRLDTRLIAEEFLELLEACGFAEGDPEKFEIVRGSLEWILYGKVGRFDMVAVADALGDLLYVVHGFNIGCGIPSEVVFDEIHRSNMKKADGPVNEHGKKLKPPDWQPPNITKVLFDLGWEGVLRSTAASERGAE